MMHTKQIKWMGQEMTLACDGNCAKAWGISQRPKVSLSNDEDDVEWLADGDLGEAPSDPGTYEGGYGKPIRSNDMNKWCSRQCERSVIAGPNIPIKLPDWSKRVQNQPWKHDNTPKVPGERSDAGRPIYKPSTGGD